MKDNKKGISCMILALGCFSLSLLVLMGQIRQRQEALADRISPSVLRFHILANSDSKKDQEIKLKVRSLILDYIQTQLPENAGKQETEACLAAKRPAIEARANEYLASHGFDYQAKLQLTRCYFPMRAYGAMVFPCGTYDAARIILGKGKGHNWWCVLYPRFCFVDAVCSEIPDESLAVLRQNIKQDDYLALEDHRPELNIRFRLFPGLSFTLPSPTR